MSAYDRPLCGARRPGWDRVAPGPYFRLPCVLAQGHVREGAREHRDAFAQRRFGSDVLVSALSIDLAAQYVRAVVRQETAR